MIEKHLSSIKDVHIFPVISLIIFLVFFIIMGIWVYRIKADYLEEMEQLPLQSSKNDFNNEGSEIV